MAGFVLPQGGLVGWCQYAEEFGLQDFGDVAGIICCESEVAGRWW